MQVEILNYDWGFLSHEKRWDKKNRNHFTVYAQKP